MTMTATATMFENEHDPDKTQAVLQNYKDYVAGGFGPLSVALCKTKNARAWDVDGKEYIDMLSMFSVVNMGHGHPKILKATIDALQEAPVLNLPFHNPYYGQLARRLHEVFGYDKFLGMTSGGEAVDAAVKIARKWATITKGIAPGKAHVLTAAACYHGVTLSTASMTSRRAEYYGPYLPSVGPISPSGKTVRFGEIVDLEQALREDAHHIAAFIVEPIQGAAGIITPPPGYIKSVAQLCKKHNVLFIADEVQTGFGRAGGILCHFQDGVRADLVVLGKALTGGMYPMSGVMGSREIMDLVSPYEIGATMANNPPGCAAALAALDVMMEEQLAERAVRLGKLLKQTLQSYGPLPHTIDLQGSGMFWSIGIQQKPPHVTGRRIAALLAQRGVLSNAVGSGARLRICPPLTISEEDLVEGLKRIVEALRDVQNIELGTIPGETLEMS